jgi:hypothetical protein
MVSKCLDCGAELAEGEEYLCDGCFRKEICVSIVVEMLGHDRELAS